MYEWNSVSLSEFHAVYMDPASWDHYKKTGEFRDGTVLIKELISVGGSSGVSHRGLLRVSFE